MVHLGEGYLGWGGVPCTLLHVDCIGTFAFWCVRTSLEMCDYMSSVFVVDEEFLQLATYVSLPTSPKRLDEQGLCVSVRRMRKDVLQGQ